MMTPIAGSGSQGFGGDNGPALGAQLSTPYGIAVDPDGLVYFSDVSNSRIRVLMPCAYAVAPTSLQASALGGNLTVSVQTAAGCPWAIYGLPNWVSTSTLSGTGSATITLTVLPNNSSSRSATAISLTGAAITLAITQAAATCTYAINPGGQAFLAMGGAGTIAITAPGGCQWS